MKNSDQTFIKEDRFIGQQLCSVLVAMDYINLKFVKYPLRLDGAFSDEIDIDMEEGFEIRNEFKAISIRNKCLSEFRAASSHLVALIGLSIVSANHNQTGELSIEFENKTIIRFLANEQGFDSFQVNS